MVERVIVGLTVALSGVAVAAGMVVSSAPETLETPETLKAWNLSQAIEQCKTLGDAGQVDACIQAARNTDW